MASLASGDLLERGAHLEALRAAQGAGGRLVLLAAEAGGGKTALVRAFCATAQARVLSGACDPLFTPRPLGPFADIAAEVGGELARVVDDCARAHDVLAVLLVELRSKPTVLVLEDLHWADEATLDVVRLLGRRVSGLYRRECRLTPTVVEGVDFDEEADPFAGSVRPRRRAAGQWALRSTLCAVGAWAAVARVPWARRRSLSTGPARADTAWVHRRRERDYGGAL